MCLEVGVRQGEVATVMTPWLSSKTALLVMVEKSSGKSRTEVTYFTKSLSERSSQKDCESATYSACNVERAISDCIWTPIEVDN